MNDHRDDPNSSATPINRTIRAAAAELAGEGAALARSVAYQEAARAVGLADALEAESGTAEQGAPAQVPVQRSDLNGETSGVARTWPAPVATEGHDPEGQGTPKATAPGDAGGFADLLAEAERLGLVATGAAVISAAPVARPLASQTPEHVELAAMRAELAARERDEWARAESWRARAEHELARVNKERDGETARADRAVRERLAAYEDLGRMREECARATRDRAAAYEELGAVRQQRDAETLRAARAEFERDEARRERGAADERARREGGAPIRLASFAGAIRQVFGERVAAAYEARRRELGGEPEGHEAIEAVAGAVAGAVEEEALRVEAAAALADAEAEIVRLNERARHGSPPFAASDFEPVELRKDDGARTLPAEGAPAPAPGQVTPIPCDSAGCHGESVGGDSLWAMKDKAHHDAGQPKEAAPEGYAESVARAWPSGRARWPVFQTAPVSRKDTNETQGGAPEQVSGGEARGEGSPTERTRADQPERSGGPAAFPAWSWGEVRDAGDVAGRVGLAVLELALSSDDCALCYVWAPGVEGHAPPCPLFGVSRERQERARELCDAWVVEGREAAEEARRLRAWCEGCGWAGRLAPPDARCPRCGGEVSRVTDEFPGKGGAR